MIRCSKQLAMAFDNVDMMSAAAEVDLQKYFACKPALSHICMACIVTLQSNCEEYQFLLKYLFYQKSL